MKAFSHETNGHYTNSSDIFVVFFYLLTTRIYISIKDRCLFGVVVMKSYTHDLKAILYVTEILEKLHEPRQKAERLKVTLINFSH